METTMQEETGANVLFEPSYNESHMDDEVATTISKASNN